MILIGFIVVSVILMVVGANVWYDNNINTKRQKIGILLVLLGCIILCCSVLSAPLYLIK